MKRVKQSKTVPVAKKADAAVEARPAPIARRDEEFFRLRIGDVLKLNDIEYVVDYINSSRARCIPLTKKHVSYETVSGKKVEFESDHSGCNISPNSTCRIIRRLGPNWRKSER